MKSGIQKNNKDKKLTNQGIYKNKEIWRILKL